MNVHYRQARDKKFVGQLIRKNMEPYYKELGIEWDQEVFDKNWEVFENYELLVDSVPVGVFRISYDHMDCYIRDVQVDYRWQCKGLGSKAIEYSSEIALNAGFGLLRLRVFCRNPAVSLYKRMGLCSKTEGEFHYMEREV